MKQTITPARKLNGELTVPGELEPALQALVLAALAQGQSTIHQVPPAVRPLLQILERLGMAINHKDDAIEVEGRGPLGWSAPEESFSLDGLGPAAPLLVALLAAQPFAVSLTWSQGQQETGTELIAQLNALGAAIIQRADGTLDIGPVETLVAAQLEPQDLPPAYELALYLAALCAQGTTQIRRPLKTRDENVRLLRAWDFSLKPQRRDDHTLLSIAGGQSPAPRDLHLAGDLHLAYPFIVAALSLKGSRLNVRQVTLNPGNRTLLDILRQLGGRIEIAEGKGHIVDLEVQSSPLKSTRIAAQRAARLHPLVPLLAILATQTQGEFVVRDIAALRQGPFDLVAHLVELLRQLGAKVGEFPEGFVVEGGQALSGGKVDARQNPALGLALGIAGLLAESELVVDQASCIEDIYPQFFATLETLKENRR
ncbi:MAG: hypothetical protein GKR89_16840 [Candidatus Latescibacteria bacterium]|nr:hypothetical protein [Candidatus Latescibacterota bacterium]